MHKNTHVRLYSFSYLREYSENDIISGERRRNTWKEKVCVQHAGEEQVERRKLRPPLPLCKDREKGGLSKAVEAGGFESLNDLIETATDRIAAEVLGLTPEQYAAEVQAAAEKAKKERGSNMRYSGIEIKIANDMRCCNSCYAKTTTKSKKE